MSSWLSDAEYRDLRAAHDRDAWASEWNGLPTAVDRIVAAREAAAREEVLARVEELAKWLHRKVLNASTENNYAIGYGNGLASARNATRALVSEFRAPDATSEARP